ncbi:hypothetical protein [Lacticaseibacillus paracasei]|jgi:hypothetical protein|nr:hypothetical protein [Lacticaseibacillus paracasei]RNE45939.1 hypothetical protein FAM8374_00540 [Lacticaseibacillus paracasei]
MVHRLISVTITEIDAMTPAELKIYEHNKLLAEEKEASSATEVA